MQNNSIKKIVHKASFSVCQRAHPTLAVHILIDTSRIVGIYALVNWLWEKKKKVYTFKY